MHNIKLEKIINKYLNIHKYQDYLPNGLQVEGCSEVTKIITGVTASQSLLDEAVKLSADAVIVHHGFFWNKESSTILNIKRNRLKTLLSNNINLYSYHLPLDIHPIVGNNKHLGDIMKVNFKKFILPLLPMGYFDKPISANDLMLLLTNKLGRKPFYVGDNSLKDIYSIAWCTGGGQDFIQQAYEAGVNAYVTGEISEHTVHIAKEMGIHFYAAGHHVTERLGVKTLGKWLQEKYKFEVIFIDIFNFI